MRGGRATPLSVVVITRNAERGLAPCLQSTAFADELLVVDSGSTDATLDIARRHGARVLHQDWLGYGAQKQFAAEQASHDWVLSLDADERLSEDLAAEIRATLVTAPSRQAYRMPRRNRFMGRWLRHGEGYPDYSLRLYDRRRARWSDDPVHERVLTEAEPGTLKGDLLHASEDGLAEYLDKQNRYSTLQAQALYAGGRRPSLLKLLLSPALRFCKFYCLRLGFLDGLPGLVHILIGCHNSFMKYAKLAALHRADDS